FALWRDLHESVRDGRGHAETVQQEQCVVFVFDEPAHRLERSLVFKGTVQDGSAELVRTVGTHVALRVELREEIPLRLSTRRGDPETKGGGTPRSLETYRFHLKEVEAELIAGRGPDRLPATPADIEMSRATSSIRHRNHLVRRKDAERDDGKPDPQDERRKDVGQVVDGFIQ